MHIDISSALIDAMFIVWIENHSEMELLAQM